MTKIQRIKKTTALLAGLLLLMATAATANALSLNVSTDGTTWQTVVDNGSGDTDVNTGSISYTNITLFGFTKVKVSGATETFLQSGQLYMNSFEASSSTGSMLYLKLSDFPYNDAFVAGAVAHTGLTMQNGNATVDLKTYYGDAIFDTAHLIADVNLTAPGFVGNTTTLPPFSNAYSLTEFLTIENIQDVSSQITASLQVVPVAPVPEPGTMALLGLGMFGLAVYGKRRAGSKDQFAHA
jgi:hypothetical protein